MPELPEVETVRRGLDRILVGKQILSVDVLNDKTLQFARTDLNTFVIGAKVVAIRRRAKMLIIDLDSDYSLLIHLKMTGQMVWRGAESWAAGHPNDSMIGDLPDRTTRIIFNFDDGQLFFNDQRKFGWIRLYPTNTLGDTSELAKLGPEPLTSDPAISFLRRARCHPRTSIKAAILNQQVIVGVGNIYADESLWLAKIHPQTKVEELSDGELLHLLECIQKSLQAGLNSGGSTMRNYVRVDGTRGNYLDKFAHVYGREGKPCDRCGHEIIKIKVAGRGTHICPNCQKLR